MQKKASVACVTEKTQGAHRARVARAVAEVGKAKSELRHARIKLANAETEVIESIIHALPTEEWSRILRVNLRALDHAMEFHYGDS